MPFNSVSRPETEASFASAHAEATNALVASLQQPFPAAVVKPSSVVSALRKSFAKVCVDSKESGLGRIHQAIRRPCEVCSKTQNGMFIVDAEETWVQPAIDEVTSA